MDLNDLRNFELSDLVGEWFQKSISAADNMALMRIETGCGMDTVPDPSREPKFVLADLAKNVNKYHGNLRYVLEDKSANYALTIDITPADIKQCPDDLVDETLLIKDLTARKSKDAACVPLLCCRYVRHEKGRPLPYQEEKWVNSLYEAGDNITTLRRETTCACIDYVYDEILEKHGSWLAAAYVESWRAKSRYNREGYFKPGFLVPLPKMLTLTAKKMPGNAMRCANQVGGCVNPGTKACAGCRSCHYCSVECQKQHWTSAHKKVCGKSVEELATAAAAEGVGSSRGNASLSVVVPITDESPCGPTRGMHVSTISTIGGISAATSPKDLYRNIHGDRRFLVKIQTGLQMGGGGGLVPNPQAALMVYDMTKSFTFNIMPPDRPQQQQPGKPQQLQDQQHYHRQLVEAIITRGVPCMNLGGRKGKGYFWAQREGTNLRIFINEQEPMQPW